jgi:preprotein translocase subunit SecG
MQTLLIVVHLMLVLGLIGVVLLQRSEGGGLGGGTSSAGFMTNRGTANVLTRATAILAAGFFLTSLTLSIIATMDRKPHSIIQNGSAPTAPATPGAPAPLSPGGGGVLNQLGGAAPAQPPAAPSGPQVPPSR